jgi:hypothetical protein
MLAVTALPSEKTMRFALFTLFLLSGCTYIPLADLGPCSATTNARACQEDPYVLKWDSADTAPSGESQKAGAAGR